ncbi:hypothetical protein BSL78_02313 [Apostichopus japonicus]|uniref:Ig-like domain-containing protein n=1 Tax=Stichopus japonicus TaxID=307972 RepID=A0A2G8LKG5_STIJA|nr:hypothetical protein BSL78_02313 [Apostichopus japonicus]
MVSLFMSEFEAFIRMCKYVSGLSTLRSCINCCVIKMAIVFQASLVLGLITCNGVCKTVGEAIIKLTEPKQDVCLICPIAKNKPNLTWSCGLDRNNYIYRSGLMISLDDVETKINDCSSVNSSLKILKISININCKEYTCWNGTEEVARFQIKIQSILTITMNRDENQYDRREESMENLTCVILGAIQPFNVTWLMNGSVQDVHLFQNSEKSEANVTSNETFTVNEENVIISCLVNGPYTYGVANISISPSYSKEQRIVRARKTWEKTLQQFFEKLQICSF